MHDSAADNYTRQDRKQLEFKHQCVASITLANSDEKQHACIVSNIGKHLLN